MEELTLKDEVEIADFHHELENIDGPDDMFPPEDGVREPLPTQPNPNMPTNNTGAIALESCVGLTYA